VVYVKRTSTFERSMTVTLNDINVATLNQLQSNLDKAKTKFYANRDTAQRIVLYSAADELGQFVVRMIGERIAVYNFALKTAPAVLRESLRDMNDEKFIFSQNSAKIILGLAIADHDNDFHLYECVRALDIEDFDCKMQLRIAYNDLSNKREDVFKLIRGLEESLSQKS
jgi:cysteine sulfinate desulfinase/cysteine desulfurase-like protein